MKNTEEMIIRSFKFRQEKAVRSVTSADLDEALKAKGKFFTYATKTPSNSTTFNRNPGNHEKFLTN